MMKARGIIAIVCCVFSVLISNAETSETSNEVYIYKSAVMFDASGPVKEIVLTKTGNPFPFIKNVKIAPDGKFENCDTMEYDASGLPVSLKMKDKETKYSFKCDMEYDSAQLLKRLTADAKMLFKVKFDCTYTYTEGRLSSQCYSAKTMAGTMVTEYEFSGHEYDDHGNWVKRHVVLKSGMKGNPLAEADPEEYDEERTISYYE